MDGFITDALHEFGRHRALAEGAMGELEDREFFLRPAGHVNSVAVIVKHLAGNLLSRWTEFLTTDGEKPTRDREAEFRIEEADTRARLMERWGLGWTAVLETVAGLMEGDLGRVVHIRGEAHTVRQAVLRGLTHAAYHAGQVLYVVRLIRPGSRWMTIPPGGSAGWRGEYRGV